MLFRSYKNEIISLDELSKGYEEKLESIYTCNINQSNNEEMKSPEYKVSKWSSAKFKVAKPKFVIPVFPGTNCEYDTAKAVERAGATAEIFVIKNLNSDMLKKSIEDFAKIIDASQVILILGGFLAGNEPDGSALIWVVASFPAISGCLKRLKVVCRAKTLPKISALCCTTWISANPTRAIPTDRDRKSVV